VEEPPRAAVLLAVARPGAARQEVEPLREVEPLPEAEPLREAEPPREVAAELEAEPDSPGEEPGKRGVVAVVPAVGCCCRKQRTPDPATRAAQTVSLPD